MARSRTRSNRGRGINTTAKRSLPLDFSITSNNYDLFSPSMLPVQDLRTFDPDPYPREISGRPARISPDRRRPESYQYSLKKSYPNLLNDIVSFQSPEKVLVCVRRKIRKEVMFAKGKAGKGGQKRPRRNHNSNIHC